MSPPSTKHIDTIAQNALIILSHPRPTSFSHVVAEHVAAVFAKLGIEIRTTDLYVDGFDPRLQKEEIARNYPLDSLVQRYIEFIESCTHLVFIHPEWWGLPPAILKGFVDRVFIPGVGYEYIGEEFLEKNRVGLLSDTRVMVLTTSDIADEVTDDRPSLAGRFWSELFAFCGVETFAIKSFRNMRESTYAERSRWLETLEPVVSDWIR